MYAVVPHGNLKTFFSIVSSVTQKIARQFYPLLHHSNRIRCTGEYTRPEAYDKCPAAMIAFFLLPPPRHMRVNLERRTGSLRIAIQEFSMRVDRINPEPIPVMLPFETVSPVEYSLQVSPTKLAIFFPLVKRDRSSPISRTNRIAVNHPIPGRLLAILKAFSYRSFRQSCRRAVRKEV